MGKIVRYNKSTLGLVIILTWLLLIPVHSYAAYTEYDLLRQGYESYLSYQPEKAAEEFRAFLKEFPRSSARDAALFWLGKSLLQAKAADEAGQVFTELKRQFPDSPFTAFIVTQSEFSESEKPAAIRETETVPPLETSKASADIEQPEPARQADEAITEPATGADSSDIKDTIRKRDRVNDASVCSNRSANKRTSISDGSSRRAERRRSGCCERSGISVDGA